MTDYLFLDSLMDKTDAKVLVGLKNSIISFGGSNSPVSPASRSMSSDSTNLRRSL